MPGSPDPSHNSSGAFRQSKVEFLLLRPRDWGDSRQRMAQGAENAQPALDSIRPDRIRDREQMAPWITNFVSFHSAILKHGVGHPLSHGKDFRNIFRCHFCSRASCGAACSRASVKRVRLNPNGN